MSTNVSLKKKNFGDKISRIANLSGSVWSRFLRLFSRNDHAICSTLAKDFYDSRKIKCYWIKCGSVGESLFEKKILLLPKFLRTTRRYFPEDMFHAYADENGARKCCNLVDLTEKEQSSP